jgi:uncharacterized protein YxeA
MSGTFILVVVMVITILLGKYALSEGQRIERQNKFMRDMENFDSKRTENEENQDKELRVRNTITI